jgi:hypothetical protein
MHILFHYAGDAHIQVYDGYRTLQAIAQYDTLILLLFLLLFYLRYLCVKPPLLEVWFRADVRVNKIETCVNFPVLFNVGT